MSTAPADNHPHPTPLLFDLEDVLEYEALGMGSDNIRRCANVASVLAGLLLLSCGGRALVPTPATGSSECDDAGTWVLCSDGKWHNGGEVLPQCPAGAEPGGKCSEGCFQMQNGLCEVMVCGSGFEATSSPCPE
jgi:hypothetical protein